MLLAWDWVKDNIWIIFVILITASVNIAYWMGEDTGDKFTLYFVGVLIALGILLALTMLTVNIVYRIKIARRIKRLTRAQKRDWIQKRKVIKNRSKRLKAQYLDGKPITIIDKKTGNIVVLQQGKKMIVSTMN